MLPWFCSCRSDRCLPHSAVTLEGMNPLWNVRWSVHSNWPLVVAGTPLSGGIRHQGERGDALLHLRAGDAGRAHGPEKAMAGTHVYSFLVKGAIVEGVRMYVGSLKGGLSLPL